MPQAEMFDERDALKPYPRPNRCVCDRHLFRSRISSYSIFYFQAVHNKWRLLIIPLFIVTVAFIVVVSSSGTIRYEHFILLFWAYAHITCCFGSIFTYTHVSEYYSLYHENLVDVFLWGSEEKSDKSCQDTRVARLSLFVMYTDRDKF